MKQNMWFIEIQAFTAYLNILIHGKFVLYVHDI